MRKFLVVGLAAVLVLGVAGVVAAANDGPPGPARAGWQHGEDKAGPPMFGLALGLDQEQLDELANVRQEYCDQSGELRKQFAGLRSRYEVALGKNDTAQIAKLRDEFAGLRQNAADLRAEYQEKALGVLTAEQRDILEQYRAEGGKRGFVGFFFCCPRSERERDDD